MDIIVIEFDSEVPLYQQLRDRVVEAIAEGKLSKGSQLPSTRQLAADFGINFHTVHKAYDALRDEGLIRLSRKSGAVIYRDAAAGPPPPEFLKQWRLRAHTLLAEAIAQGTTPETVLAELRAILAQFPDPTGTPPVH
ncbi:MAG: GntR family transcriptional regulator [Kibdelosporangium sp.]